MAKSLVFYDGVIASEARRVTTLQLLGIIATLTGLLITLTAPSSGTSLILFAELLWWPYLAGGLLTVCGLVQTIGSFTRFRLSAAWIGALAVGGWYGWFGLGFVWQWLVWEFGDALPLDEPPIYPMALYLGLASLHILSAHAARENLRMNR